MGQVRHGSATTTHAVRSGGNNGYVLLADEAAVNDVDAIALYRLGMKAGELALGPEFEELKGEF